MSDEATAIGRRVEEAVRNTVAAYRIQAQPRRRRQPEGVRPGKEDD